MVPVLLFPGEISPFFDKEIGKYFYSTNFAILGSNFAQISIPKNEKKTLVAKDLINDPVRISLSLFVTLEVIDRHNSSCCSNQSGSLQGRPV